MVWVKGQSGNPKGSKPGGNPGAGRPPDGLRAMCQEIIKKRDLVQRLGKFGSGERIQQVVTDEGEEIPVPPKPEVQIKATEILLGYAYGKPEQSIVANVTNTKQPPPVEDVIDAITSLKKLLSDIDTGSGEPV